MRSTVPINFLACFFQDGRFAEQMAELLASGGRRSDEKNEDGHPFVMFLVDDLIFFKTIDLSKMTSLLVRRMCP